MTVLLALLLSAAAPTAVMAPSPPSSLMASLPSCARGCMEPVETITLADQIGERGFILAEFSMKVQAVGSEKGLVYLNSETDYRARNNLTVALTEAEATGLLGTADKSALREQLIGRTVIVRGMAQRVRIDFTSNGQPTGKYYYQVHVRPGPGASLRVR